MSMKPLRWWFQLGLLLGLLPFWVALLMVNGTLTLGGLVRAIVLIVALGCLMTAGALALLCALHLYFTTRHSDWRQP